MIFILGGKGFVGSGYARVCEASGRKYQVIDRGNYASFVGQHCDVLINAAGNSKKFLARQNPVADFDTSVRAVHASLVDFCCDTYVLVSSADVYPDSSSPATTSESQFLEVPEMSPYGFHKYLAELCVRHAAKRWIIARCGGFVGPLMKKNPIYDILHGGPLWLAPESELQYIHTDQAAKIIMDLADRGITKEILNVCGAGVVRLSNVMQWAKREVPIHSGSPRFRCELDLAKASALVDLPTSESVVREFVTQLHQL
jgi:nucleoside-diphosphate-sugar epimerase